MFRIAAVIGVINILTLVVGLSFPLFCELAEMCGAKVLGSGSTWEEFSRWCFTTYFSLSPLAMAFIWIATILGFSWLITNWKYWVVRYWEGPKPIPQPKPQLDPKDDYALRFQVW